IENTPIKVTEEKVGSIYRQKYKEGNRVQEYDIHTLEYTNQPSEKKLKVGFNLANWIEITADYELVRVDDQRTRFRYTVTNKALKWFMKLFMLLANDKVVVKFLEKVKEVAESEAPGDDRGNLH